MGIQYAPVRTLRIILLKKASWELSWQCSSWDSMLPVQGAQVQSLVRELRSHRPHGMAPKKVLKSYLKIMVIFPVLFINPCILFILYIRVCDFFFSNSVQIPVACFIYLFICGCMAYRILVPWPGIEHESSVWKWALTTGLPGNPQYFVPLILFHQSGPLFQPPACW